LHPLHREETQGEVKTADVTLLKTGILNLYILHGFSVILYGLSVRIAIVPIPLASTHRHKRDG
jgi:hypothetical protein